VEQHPGVENGPSREVLRLRFSTFFNAELKAMAHDARTMG
jgi:hypothetical protein